LAAGKHTITVKNASGCTTTTDINLKTTPAAPDAPTYTLTDPTCTTATGTIVITSPTAGLEFSLDGGAFGAYPSGGYSGVASGSHTLTVRNAGGCTTAVTITMKPALPAPAAPTYTVTPPTCTTPTGTIVITSPTTGLEFSFDGGTFGPYPAGGYTGVGTGSHTIAVRTPGGCSASVTAAMGSAPGAPAAPTYTVSDPSCTAATGSITITSSTTGIEYSFDGGAFGPYPAGGYTGLAAGKHTITVKNASGCTTTTDINLKTTPAAPDAPTYTLTDPTCTTATGTIVITSPTAGLEFSLDGGAFGAYPSGGYSGVASGSHTLTVRNAGGCTTAVTITMKASSSCACCTNLYSNQSYMYHTYRNDSYHFTNYRFRIQF
jgi:hypothetical protein